MCLSNNKSISVLSSRVQLLPDRQHLKELSHVTSSQVSGRSKVACTIRAAYLVLEQFLLFSVPKPLKASLLIFAAVLKRTQNL